MAPFLLMGAFYMAAAVLMAADASLVSFNILPGHLGVNWLRIHFVTIGTVTQALFGVLPALVAKGAGRSRPPVRWDVWLTLNAGFILLVIGMPMVNPALIIAGGTLVFAAVGLLIGHLRGLRAGTHGSGAGEHERGAVTQQPRAAHGRRFYIAGAAYLLVGIVVGTGMFLGWGKTLRIADPIEVHIHANNWGFMALVFAGLLVDVFPRIFGRPLAKESTISAIFWMLTTGALGLVIGPWVEPAYALPITVPGLLLHTAATVWLWVNIVKPVWKKRGQWGPGMWHLATSYVWFLAPVMIAPLILFKVPGFPGAGIEANAPQALVYGWVMHFGYALLPYLLNRAFFPDRQVGLGGSWLSLITVHIGGAFLWASIFLLEYQATLRGLAYGFWAISLVPMTMSVWRILRDGFAEPREPEPAREAA